MRIVCPTCTAAYEVPSNLLTPDQVVRCVRCGGEWTPPSEAEEGAPSAALAESVPGAMQEIVLPIDEPLVERRITRPQPSVRAPAHVVLRAAWAASVVLIGVLVWGAYNQRSSIMQSWPPSIRLYSALGLGADH